MNRRELRALLREDLAGHGLNSFRFRERLRRPELNYQRAMRSVEYYCSKPKGLSATLGLVAKYRLARWATKTGITFPAGVAGGGLSIAHIGSVVVNSDARVGRFLRIHSGVTIGGSRTGAPVIGDFVYLGPGAVLYGPITIGDRAVIGANAVVNSDVPPGGVAVGAPARVVSNTGSDRVVPKWFPNAAVD